MENQPGKLVPTCIYLRAQKEADAQQTSELTHWWVGKHNSHRLNKTLKKANHNLELAQRHVIVVKTRQEQNMFTRNEVLGWKPSNLNVVRAIGKFIPLRRVEGKSIWIFLLEKKWWHAENLFSA